MLKGACSKLLLNSKNTRFEGLWPNDNRKISTFQKGMQFNIDIYGDNKMTCHWKFGKIINIFTIVNNDRYTISVGDLNSIKILIKQICLFSNTNKKLKKICIGKYEFLANEIADFSLRSIGINEDVECNVEFDN